MKVSSLVRLSIGLVLLGALLRLADFNVIRVMISQLNGIYALMGMVAFLVTGLLDMWRLRLASPIAQGVDLAKFVRLNIESYFVAQFVPGQVGMDIYRVMAIGGERNNYFEPALVIFLLRFFSLAMMLFLAALFIFFLPEWRVLLIKYDIFLYAVPPLLLGVFLGYLFLKYFLVGLLDRVVNKIAGRFRDALGIFKRLAGAAAFKLIAISLLMIVSRVLTFQLTLLAFYINIDAFYSASIALLASIAWLVPISPAGVGVREGVITGLLALAGISFETALVVALLNRIYFILMGVVGGVVYCFSREAES